MKKKLLRKFNIKSLNSLLLLVLGVVLVGGTWYLFGDDIANWFIAGWSKIGG